MKATGIVRRIDDLGRVVIPKEIRRTMRIREGDPLAENIDTRSGVLHGAGSRKGTVHRKMISTEEIAVCVIYADGGLYYRYQTGIARIFSLRTPGCGHIHTTAPVPRFLSGI